MVLYDRYGRPLFGLRITVTHRCNYNCIYCHMEGEERADLVEMGVEEIARIVRVAAKFGVFRVKLTGGEPLVREDIVDIVGEISKIGGIKDLAMTSNASLLYDYAEKLAKAGLMRINVNLPSINPETYMRITGSNFTPKEIIAGIREAKKFGIRPIKVNMVLLRNLNDGEVDEMIKFAHRENLILQLIELEPIGIDRNLYKDLHVDLGGIEKRIALRAVKVMVRRDMQNRRKYFLDNGAEVEIVKPIEDGSFCMACTRIRLTADGKLKPCLMRNDNLVDVLSRMRSGASDRELEELFIMAVRRREPYWKKGDLHLKYSI